MEAAGYQFGSLPPRYLAISITVCLWPSASISNYLDNCLPPYPTEIFVIYWGSLDNRHLVIGVPLYIEFKNLSPVTYRGGPLL